LLWRCQAPGTVARALQTEKETLQPVILSADFMILRLTTVHENGSLEVTPVFSTKASAIFIAAKNLRSCGF